MLFFIAWFKSLLSLKHEFSIRLFDPAGCSMLNNVCSNRYVHCTYIYYSNRYVTYIYYSNRYVHCTYIYYKLMFTRAKACCLSTNL